MYKFRISLQKEFLILFSDKVGIALMFVMPMLLIFVITIIQDSAFNIITENKISMLIVNNDNGKQGNKLTNMLFESKMFNISQKHNSDTVFLKREVLNGNSMVGIFIPENFSEKINLNSENTANIILANFGLSESIQKETIETAPILFFNDPILQDNFCFSILNSIYTYLNIIENTNMLENIFFNMGHSQIPEDVKHSLTEEKIKIKRRFFTQTSQIPNSTQHNVPAWTLFALYFMVISLGANIVIERTSGSFLRLKTIPTNFRLIMISKQTTYMIVGLIQVLLIFCVGFFIFPMINLPELSFPTNIIGTIVLVLLSCFAAVSYSLMVGTLAETIEQSNGFGALSIIIFAAIGGVWVPTFVMPDYMKIISKISPLQWSLEGFYFLFLKNGHWGNLIKPIIGLFIFSFVCQLITFVKLKKDKILS